MTRRPMRLRSASWWLLASLAGGTAAAQPPRTVPPTGGVPTSRPVQRPTAPPTVAYVRVTGVDYAFDAPDTVRAGIVAFNLVNVGTDLHQLAVYDLPGRHTLKEFLDQYHAQGIIPSWVTALGQTAVLPPQSETFLTVRLKPGRYLLVCPMPARDGRLHTEKGMVRMITAR